MKRMVVTRGEHVDVATWVDDADRGAVGSRGGGPPSPNGPNGPSDPNDPSGPTGPTNDGITIHPGRRHEPALIAVMGVILLGGILLAWLELPAPERHLVVTRTIGDLAPVHAGVRLGGAAAPRPTRLAEGDVVETDEDGRARLRLDGGAAVVLDRGSRLEIRAASIELLRGRAFVDAPAGGRVDVRLAGATSPIAEKTAVALERTEGGGKLYVARGEATVQLAGRDEVVHGGETASVEGGKVVVAPERSFDDWTAGLTAPWSSAGPPRRALAEATGRSPDGSASASLATRGVDVRATIHGEAAETKMLATFFNAGDSVQVADVKLALPPGAIVSGFAIVRDGARREAQPVLASRTATAAVPPFEVLEWAGESWVRATLPAVAPGQSLGVEITWVEWLGAIPSTSSATRRFEYRLPMVGEGETTSRIGELAIRVDATPSEPLALSAPAGATVQGEVVSLARSDARPTSDFVVGIELPRADAPARAFLAPPGPGDEGARTLLLRAEAPAPRAKDAAPAGMDLVVVLDRSSSVEPAMLEAGRTFVQALVDALGPRDRVAVLASDSAVAAVGPAGLGPADAARRAAIRAALETPLAPGGATDLGVALEHAADLLPADAPAGLVVYVGDGWPTWGDLGPEAIRARLARRARGAPRLGAVALGPVSNRVGLAALVRGTGPLLEVADAEGAARAAIDLLAGSVGPAVADVRVDLGPTVERIHPRGPLALRAGETFSMVGKLRGAAPTSVRVDYRDAEGVTSVRHAVVTTSAPRPDDVRRRWAAARVETIALAGTGREAATHVALGAGLLTPWTALAVGAPGEYTATPLGARILDLSSDVGFGAAFATRGDRSGVIPGLEEAGVSDVDLETAVRNATGRILAEARASLRACRDARAALRPTIGRHFSIALTIDGEGKATKVALGGADVDAELERCVQAVVVGLTFPAGGDAKPIEITHQVVLPEVEVGRRRTCSDLSRLPVPQRRGAWQLRIEREGPVPTILAARRTCELSSWTAQRALLELVLTSMPDLANAAYLAAQLDENGESEAALLLRREALRRARSPVEVTRLRSALLATSRLPAVAFRKAYDEAKDDDARRKVVARFFAFAPHDRRLLDRLLALSAKDPDRLRTAVRRVLDDPFADAALVATAAERLRAVGDLEPARRAFEEIVERSPRDPWARAFLGDRLRAVGDVDGAAAVYTALEALDPDEPAAVVRLALAHAGAGRTDLALRMLARVARTGGRNANADLAKIAAALAHVVVREAMDRKDLPEGSQELLARALAELPPPSAAGGMMLLQIEGGGPTLSAELVRGPENARERRSADASAPGMGLWLFDVGASDLDGSALRVARGAGLPPGAPLAARVVALTEGEGARLAVTALELPLDGAFVRAKLRADGSAEKVEAEKK